MPFPYSQGWCDEFSPELAVLSVLAHGHDEVEVAVKEALAAMSAVTHLGDQDRFVLYSDLILTALSDAARKALQMIPEGYQFRSPIIRESIEKGLIQGHAEGETKGRAEGRTFEKALSVLEVFEARDIPVSPDQRGRILACTDLEQLSRWHKRAIKVASVDELFTQ
ncbi:MAG: hypothetical protein QM784_33500 [Polyangiaceae bacterium]